MRVLVIGGTGFNGRRIVARLLQHDHEVTVVARGAIPAGQAGRVSHVRVDRKDPAAFSAAFADASFDAVIDNVAYEPEDARIALDTLGARTGQYLFTSTLAVYHDLPTRITPAHEDDADLGYVPGPDEGLETALHPTKGHAYAIAKRQVEQVVRASGVTWTALRASMVVGPDDWVGVIWWWVQRLLDGLPILVPDRGYGHQFQVTYVEDLADAFLAALSNPVAYNRAYNIAGPHLLTTDSWAAALAEPLGTRVECVHVPPALITAAGLTDYRVPIAGLPFGHVFLDTCRARDELRFQASPIEVWATDTVLGCAAHPPAHDSRHYDRRAQEVEMARCYAEARARAEASCLAQLTSR